MEISVIVPIYNDGYLAEDFCHSIEKTFSSFLNQAGNSEFLELIFVNDGSLNNSWEELLQVARKFSFVKLINLSRNFGQHIALSCGYKNAKGNYVAMINVDMQEPTSELFQLYLHIKNSDLGVVYGLVDFRRTTFINRITSKAFNNLMGFLTREKVPSNIATIRIMSRKFIDVYNELTEKTRYLPGLENWLGFKKDFIKVEHRARERGKSSYSTRKRLEMAMETIISFSDFPLRLIVLFGSLVAFIGIGLSFYIVITKLFFIDYQAGYATTIALITSIGGVQMVVIGIASMYIGRILKEVQNRPLYVISNKINFNE
jgi:glycosyltransferase involved in cell wall biosynthesis